MKNLVFGLLAPKLQQNNANDETGKWAKLRELTIAWSRYGYRGPIIEAASISEILDRSLEKEFRYCLIQSVGHIVDEQWYLPHWQKEGFHQTLHTWLQNADFLVAGSWQRDRSGYVGLQTDCMLVDLQWYLKLGKPFFGQGTQDARKLCGYEISSLDKDRLNPSPETIEAKPNLPGWHFIDVSLRQGIPVSRLPLSMDENRLNLLGNQRGDIIAIENSANDDFCCQLGQLIKTQQRDGQRLALQNQPTFTTDQKTFLKRIENQIAHAQQGVFLWNIESYQDLMPSQGDESLQALYSVAAGFKPNRILETHGFDTDTRVIFFDYSQPALNIRKHLVTSWDGDNFPQFVRHLFETYPHPQTFYQLWHGATPETVDWADIEWCWQKELDQWGGAQAFKKHWQTYQQLSHEYLCCNLLTNPQPLLQKMRSPTRTYLWWSNAFFTVYGNWYYRTAERKAIYEQWIASLAAANPHCQINGADYNNIAVNGLTVQDYLHCYRADPCDELNPKKRGNVEICF